MKVIICLVLAGFIVTSWARNLTTFVDLDFKAPYKAEILHGLGVAPIPIISLYTGWVDIEDKKLINSEALTKE